MTAVQVHGTRSLVTLGTVGFVRGRRRIGALIHGRCGLAAGLGASRVVMVVVTEVRGARLAFMPAVRRHGRPGELERQQGK